MKDNTPLQRGKACLCCRKRKMKCDGARPVCTQCVKANRDSECHYHDKKQISRTQLLQQKVAKLEARLRELESEQCEQIDGSPAPSLAESYASSSSDSSSSISRNHSNRSGPSPLNDWDFRHGEDAPLDLAPPFDGHRSLQSTPGSSSSPDFFRPPSTHCPHTSNSYSPPRAGSSKTPATKWWDDQGTFCQQKQALVDIFLPHRHQFALDIHIERFQSSLTFASPDQPHPALMDAIYLTACHLSQSPSLTELEPHFLKRALFGISDALQHNDRVINVLQASCLVSLYFLIRGRVLEGYYHSSIAARLAVSLGLHQIRQGGYHRTVRTSSPGCMNRLSLSPNASTHLAPPKDAIETEERVAAFWQVFMIDRAWSVATGLPAALPDDDHPHAQIETAWPSPLSRFPGVFNGASGQRYDPVTLYPTLRAKAIALYERTHRLASTSVKNDSFWIEHRSLEMSLSQFGNSLPLFGLATGRASLSLLEVDLFAVHAMTHVSAIFLHRELAQTSTQSYEKAWIAANTVTSLIRELTDRCYDYLDPVVSMCWFTTAEILIKSLLPASSQGSRSTNTMIEQEVDVLVTSLRRLGRMFPIAGIHATKVENLRTSALAALGLSQPHSNFS